MAVKSQSYHNSQLFQQEGSAFLPIVFLSESFAEKCFVKKKEQSSRSAIIGTFRQF